MKIKTLIVAVLLLVSSVASAITVPMDDGSFEIYDPLNDYPVNVVLGGSDPFTFGFGFVDPLHRFVVDINVPSNFVGSLDTAITSGPDGTGTLFGWDVLYAGESISYNLGGFLNASTNNPVPMYLSLWALGMPSQTSFSGIISSVPIPSAVWLFGSGLLGLVGVARRRQPPTT